MDRELIHRGITGDLKGSPDTSEKPAMPSFMAFTVATLAAWIVHRAISTPEGMLLPSLLAGIFWLLAFYFVRRWFGELRPDI